MGKNIEGGPISHVYINNNNIIIIIFFFGMRLYHQNGYSNTGAYS